MKYIFLILIMIGFLPPEAKADTSVIGLVRMLGVESELNAIGDITLLEEPARTTKIGNSFFCDF